MRHFGMRTVSKYCWIQVSGIPKPPKNGGSSGTCSDTNKNREIVQHISTIEMSGLWTLIIRYLWQIAFGAPCAFRGCVAQAGSVQKAMVPHGRCTYEVIA
jgi:hypothetical protein